MIQDVVLIGAKTVELKFSRLVHLKDTNVLKKKNYTIQLNGEKVDINAIKIAQKSTESTHNKEKEELTIEGIQSVHISFHTNLFNKEVDVCIKHPPQDVHGNSAPKAISWPR